MFKLHYLTGALVVLSLAAGIGLASAAETGTKTMPDSSVDAPPTPPPVFDSGRHHWCICQATPATISTAKKTDMDDQRPQSFSSVEAWLAVESVMRYANMTGHPAHRGEAERMMDAYFDCCDQALTVLEWEMSGLGHA